MLIFGNKPITKSGIYSTTQRKKLMETEKIVWDITSKDNQVTMIYLTNLTILKCSVQLRVSQSFTKKI